jgi:hypothetical protein
MKVEIGPYPDVASIFYEQEISVRIDEWDTWNMAETLGEIALPMLKQLKEQKHGSPHVELEDVPEELRLHGTSSNESMQYDMFASEEHDSACWQVMHDRWDWVMDEMIFAFESIVGSNDDWEDKYYSGKTDFLYLPLDKYRNPLGPPQKLEDDTPSEIESKVTTWEVVRGPNDTSKFDKAGYQKEGERIANGFRLFGKYYQGLWD